MGIPTRSELDALIQQRLASEPDFRASLLADPRAAIAALIGMEVPPFVNFEVHEETLTQVHLVLPPAKSGGEIPDDVLEQVAGGGGVCWGNCSDYGP